MARTTDSRQALVEIKAVDALYPLYGAVTLDPPLPLASALAQRDGAFGAAVDATLLARLELKPGARITVGSATFEITATIQNEPDKLATGLTFGPRVIVSEAALRATGLLVPGSLVRWAYRLRLPDGSDAAAGAVTAAANAQLPDAGWQIRGRTNATPALERNIDHFTQFLTLVGLTALLVGGVGVANAVKSHIDRKRDVIATLKALGASGGRVFAIYLWQVLLLSAVGAAIGLVLGAILPFAVAALFGSVIPLPIAPAVHPLQLLLAFFYGLLTALAFALWPLGRAHDVPVSALFRDAVAPGRRWPRRRYVIASALVVLAVAAIAVGLSYDRKIAAIFIVAAAAVFAALELVALLVMAVARRLPHARAMALRLAIANMHRPGALTPTIVLSLGLGLTLLVTVFEIDGNLKRQFEGALPEHAPSFYFLDIQSADAGRFDAFVRKEAPEATLERVPMLRGRIMSANGISADDIKAQPNAAWVLQSDRGITFATEVPQGSNGGRGRLVDGRLQGTAAGVVREQDRGRTWIEGRRSGGGQRARPQHPGAHRQPSRGAMGKSRHQLRAGVLAQRVRRRAVHRHRHLDLSGRRHAGAGDRAAEGRQRCISGGDGGAGQGRHRGGRRHRAQPGARHPRRQPGGADCGDAGARRRARSRS